jgi:hypothetical protein
MFKKALPIFAGILIATITIVGATTSSIFYDTISAYTFQVQGGSTGCLSASSGTISIATAVPSSTPSAACASTLQEQIVSLVDYGLNVSTMCTNSPNTGFTAALTSALTAAGSFSGGAIVLMPGTAVTCVATKGDYTIPEGVTLVGMTGNYDAEFEVLGKLTFSADAGCSGLSIKNGYNSNVGTSDQGIYYSTEDQFNHCRFASLGPSSATLVQASGPHQAPVFFISNDFRNESTSANNVTLLQITNNNNVGSDQYSTATIIDDNDFNDENASGTSTQAMVVTGASGAVVSNVIVSGNVESGPDLTIASVFQSSGASGYLENLHVGDNSFLLAPTFTNLDNTSTVGINSIGPAMFSQLLLGTSASNCPVDFGHTFANTLYINCAAYFNGTVKVPGVGDSETVCTNSSGQLTGCAPAMSVGSGAPSGTCTAGSLYMRTDTSAASGSEAYVCRNVAGTGTWEALSGG